MSDETLGVRRSPWWRRAPLLSAARPPPSRPGNTSCPSIASPSTPIRFIGFSLYLVGLLGVPEAILPHSRYLSARSLGRRSQPHLAEVVIPVEIHVTPSRGAMKR